MQDVDTIDLTGDLDLIPTSSDKKDEFEEPCRLWTEEAAYRKEPTEKRGKKRKSEEYASDLLSPKESSRKARSPLLSKKSAHSDWDHPTNSPRRAPKDGTPRSRRKQDKLSYNRVDQVSVPDSDDESVGSLFDLVETKQMSPRNVRKPLYPVLPSQNTSSTSGPSASPNQREPISPDSMDMSENTSPILRQENNTIPHESRAVPTVPSSTAKSNNEPMDKDLEKFFQIPADPIHRLTSRLQSTINENSNILFEHLEDGFSDEKLALLTENGHLATRVKAIQTLIKQKSAYLSCEKELENLKQNIKKAFNQGIMTIPEIEQQKKVKSQIKDIETDLQRLLRDTDLFSALDKDKLDPKPFELERLKTLPSTRVKPAASDNRRLEESPMATSGSSKPPSMPQTRDSRFSHPAPVEYGTGSFSGSFRSPAKPSSSRYDDPMITDDEAAFTRTMGSPLPPVEDNDEFDMDVLDEDMLEAEDFAQNDRQFSQDMHEPPSCTVFAETSGNAPRLPATQKSQTHSALWDHHPWTKDVKNVLRERFHLRGFRMNQLEAIDSTLSGKDTFVLMPTGGGKSLCYQLPAVISSGSTRGVTIVISPLLSLMQDQVSHLRHNNIKAYLINGELQQEERTWITSRLRGGNPERHIEVLYITPEMIKQSGALTDCLEVLYDKQRLARIVIDEAHCVSQWGHDFRPDYKEIGAFRDRIPGVPMMALTATATENVKVDVIHNLNMQGCEVFTQSFNRPNLTYEVRRKNKHAQVLQEIAETIKNSYRNKSGIIYCLSRSSCETVAKALREKHRMKAEHYHAGLDAEERAETQQRWQVGEVHVIVATIAFGMGIDKPDVRFVIHFSIPKSLEGYYQETGRAGRDGKRSGCYLYFSWNDVTAMENMINQNDISSKLQKERQLKMLRDVAKYCNNQHDCRRVQILAYFSESFRRQDCNSSCDNCKSGGTFEVRDFSQHASAIVKIVRYFQQRDERVTMGYCVNTFQGTNKSFKTAEHKKAPCFGVGSDIAKGDAERLFRKLLGEGALREENVVNKGSFPIQYMKLGLRANDFEGGRRRCRLDVRIDSDSRTRGRGDAERNYLPQSTNVSSPVQSANRRRLDRYKYTDAASDDSDSDMDSDGFEKVRVAGRKERKGKNLPGPPITQDHRFDQLDTLHKTVAEDFMVYAKNYCQSVRASLCQISVKAAAN